MNYAPNFAFFTEIGIDESVIKMLQKMGIKLVLGLTELALYSPNNSLLVTVALSKNTNDLMKGLVGPTLLKQVRGQIVHAIKIALEKNLTSQQYPIPVESIADGIDAQGLSSLLSQSIADGIDAQVMEEIKNVPPFPESLKKTPQGKTIHDVKIPLSSLLTTPVEKDVKKIMQNAPVALVDADSMYSPVRGTSQDSVYFVVAMAEKYNVAARITPGQVSVRVEGAMSQEDVTAWEAVGVSPKKMNGKIPGYLSGHFELGGVPPHRVLAAVLVGVGLEFKTVMPNVKYIQGAGK